jgi:DNA-binding response OmpR family regulator
LKLHLWFSLEIASVIFVSLVRFGEISADFSNMDGRRAREPVALTAMELKLFRFLVNNAGRVTSRNKMLDEVWDTRTIRPPAPWTTTSSGLTEKLESDPANPVDFRPVHRVGYKVAFSNSHIAAEHKM